MHSVPPDTYSKSYYLYRCGGVEFFDRYKADILKPMMQLAKMRADLKQGMRILDVGCGRGEMVGHLHALGFDVLGIDYAKDAVDVAQRFFPQCRFKHGNLLEMGLHSQSFDRIFFLGTIEHITNEQIHLIFSEFKRLLKPGGYVIVTTCTNSLYLKTLTYSFRRRCVGFLSKLGIRLKAPSPPRSTEDFEMHINEQNYFSLQDCFLNWEGDVTIEARLNPKLCVDELYGENLPPDFPLRKASPLKKIIFRLLLHIPFVKLIITRANLVLLKSYSV